MMKNIFEHIQKVGSDDDFEPHRTDSMKATRAGVGTIEKLEALAKRVAEGLPLWHDDDNEDFGKSDLAQEA